MSRASRFLILAYAAAIATVAIALCLHRYNRTFGAETVLVSLAYLVLALGYSTARDRERAPARVWMVVAFFLLVSLPLPPVLHVLAEGNLLIDGPWSLILCTLTVLAYLGIALLLLREFHSQDNHHRLRRVVDPIVLFCGAVLVFASLFLPISDNHQNGWSVLLIKPEAAWITAHVNVGTPILFGKEIGWLQPFYAYAGYPIYLITLVATLVIVVAMAARRFSLERARDSSFIAGLAVILSLASFWVLTDIFWGWHFDLSDTPWAAAVATALWLAGPLTAAVLLVPLLWRRGETWRLRGFLLLLIPIAVFNLMPLQFYFEGEDIHLSGLGALIIGLQLENWVCLDLLAYRAHKDIHGEIVVSAGEPSTREPLAGVTVLGRAS